MKKNQGFTLIEIAVVLLIGGLLMAAGASSLYNYIQQSELRKTRTALEAIDGALQVFLSLNGRYPCVAPLNTPIDDAAFGFEIADCTTAPEAVNGRGGRKVRIGAVPVRSLNLPDNLIADAWGGRFTYAVTEDLATSGGYKSTEGAIFIRDSFDNEIVRDSTGAGGVAHYVVVSHGKNNSGATSTSGTGLFACPAGNKEQENCNGDAIFRSTMLISTANNANLYDDVIVRNTLSSTIPSGAVMAFDLAACPPGWDAFSAGDGRFIVGTDGATYALGAVGGSDKVALKNDEMGIIVDTANTTSPTAGAKIYVATDGASPTPHENRPPYIALLYCKKS